LLDEVAAHLPATGSAFEIVDGVGHFLHVERPEAVGSKILTWLGD
jgi:pimeloyl-ACP methyl ester carboxylesterase